MVTIERNVPTKQKRECPVSHQGSVRSSFTLTSPSIIKSTILTVLTSVCLTAEREAELWMRVRLVAWMLGCCCPAAPVNRPAAVELCTTAGQKTQSAWNSTAEANEEF